MAGSMTSAPQQPDRSTAGGDAASSASALEAARREKLRKLQELGVDPWGQRFDDHQPIADIRGRLGEVSLVTAAGERIPFPTDGSDLKAFVA
jgi:hypothetical protein